MEPGGLLTGEEGADIGGGLVAKASVDVGVAGLGSGEEKCVSTERILTQWHRSGLHIEDKRG